MPPGDDPTTGSQSPVRGGRRDFWCSCGVTVIFLIAFASGKTRGESGPNNRSSNDPLHYAGLMGPVRVKLAGHEGQLTSGKGQGVHSSSTTSTYSTTYGYRPTNYYPEKKIPQRKNTVSLSRNVERSPLLAEVSPNQAVSFHPKHGKAGSDSLRRNTKWLDLLRSSSKDDSSKSKIPRTHYEFKCALSRTTYFWFGGLGCRSLGSPREQLQWNRTNGNRNTRRDSTTVKSEDVVNLRGISLSHEAVVIQRGTENKSSFDGVRTSTESNPQKAFEATSIIDNTSTKSHSTKDKIDARTHRKLKNLGKGSSFRKPGHSDTWFESADKPLQSVKAMQSAMVDSTAAASKLHIMRRRKSKTAKDDNPTAADKEAEEESVARHPIKTDPISLSVANGDSKSPPPDVALTIIAQTTLRRSSKWTDDALSTHVRQSRTDINTTIRTPWGKTNDVGREAGSPLPPAGQTEENASSAAMAPEAILKDGQRPPNEKSIGRTKENESFSSSFIPSSSSHRFPSYSSPSSSTSISSYSPSSHPAVVSSSSSSIASASYLSPASPISSTAVASAPLSSSSSSLSFTYMSSSFTSVSPSPSPLGHPSTSFLPCNSSLLLLYISSFILPPSLLSSTSSLSKSSPSTSPKPSPSNPISNSGLSSYHSVSSTSSSSSYSSVSFSSPSPSSLHSSFVFPNLHKTSAEEIVTQGNPMGNENHNRFSRPMQLHRPPSPLLAMGHAAVETAVDQLPRHPPNSIEAINASTVDGNSAQNNAIRGVLGRSRLRRLRKDLRQRKEVDRINIKEKNLRFLLYDDQAVAPDSNKAARDRMKSAESVKHPVVMDNEGEKSGLDGKDNRYMEGNAKEVAGIDSDESPGKADFQELETAMEVGGTQSSPSRQTGSAAVEEEEHFPIYNFNDAENRTRRMNVTSFGFGLIYQSELVDERSDEIQGPQPTKVLQTEGGEYSSERKRTRLSNMALEIVGCGFCHPDEFQDWPEAEEDFAWITACGIHMYGLGIAYLCLIVYLAFATVRFAVGCGNDGRMNRSVSLVALGMLIAAAATRGIFFLTDGYNRNGSFSRTSASFLFNLIYPCLTVPFGLHLAALSRMLNTDLGRCGSRWPVILVAAHLLVTVVVDCLASLVDPRSFLLVVPQTSFSACACVLFSWYIYSYRIFSTLAIDDVSDRRESVSLDLSMDSRTGQGFAAGLRVLFGSAIAGTLCVLLAMFDVINAANRSITAPWFLWLLGSLERVLELGVCAGLGCVTSAGYWTLSISLCHRKSSAKNQPQTHRWMKILSLRLPCFWSYAETTTTSKADHHRRSGGLLRLPWRFLKKRKRLSSGVGSNDSREVHLTGCFGQRSMGSKIPNFCSSSSTLKGKGHADLLCDAAENNRFIISPDEAPTVVRRAAERYADKQRPRSSMLINDNGFIRFRLEGDPEGSLVADSTDDDLEAAANADLYPNGSQSASKRNTVEMDLCHRFSHTDPTTGRGGLVTHNEHPCNVPWNSSDTPLTPLSLFGSADESSLNVFNFKLPSIHLRESIDRALNATGSFGRPGCYPTWRSSLDRLSVSTQPTRDDDMRSTSDRFVILPGTGSQPSVSDHGRRSSATVGGVTEMRSSVPLHAFFRSRSGSRATPRSSNGSLNMSLCDQRYSVLERSDGGGKANLF